MLIKKIILLVLLVLFGLYAQATDMLLEVETFSDRGGWVIDTQFVDVMGSPFLLAHGFGNPVDDAVQTISLPHDGNWRFFVRTRDWTPDYDGDKPGQFQVLVDGIALDSVMGITPSYWGWVDGGIVDVSSTNVQISLHDLTGFEGRCDAIFVTDDLTASAPADDGDDLAAWRKTTLGEPDVPLIKSTYDFVVVGGGIAGTCAAIAAAERGISVALIQDRPVLGGNGSNEIRVKTEGEKRHRIVTAVANNASNTKSAQTYDDARMAEVATYTNIALFTGWRAYGVETNGLKEITAIDAREMSSGIRQRFSAPLFADCTGDGWIGYWAGATFFMGREAKDEFDESYAPSTADDMTMGNTLMWTTKDVGISTNFPAVPWALSVAGTRSATSSQWYWEYGMQLNTIADAEEIRDHLFRAIYGSFYNAKQDSDNDTIALDWVPYIAGKRESRRLLGDYLLTQDDIVDGIYFDDAVGTATWSIDLHYETSVSYLSGASQYSVNKWYFPYRCLYSRDIPNLFMAGRDISVTHVGLGSPRVMNTCGQMGVAVGYAAALCREYDCQPRDIYRSASKTAELQMIIGGVWPERVYVNPEEPQESVIVDNLDAETSGTWKTSTYETGYFYGDNYFHSNKSASDDLWICYRPTVSGGVYELQEMWNGSSAGSRATEARVEIVYQDGVTTNYVDMTQNPGVWNSLGYYRLPSGSTNSVKLLTIGSADSYVIADAFKWVNMGGIIIDNSDSTGVDISGNWDVTNNVESVYGNNSLISTSANSNTWVEFYTDISENYGYQVYLYWGDFTSAATNVEVEVNHSDGTSHVYVDMSQNGEEWNLLGAWQFDTNSAVSVKIYSELENQVVAADAVMLQPYNGPDEDDWDANGLPDVWERYYFLKEYGVDPDDDEDSDGLCNGAEYVAGTDPTDSQSTFSICDMLNNYDEDIPQGEICVVWPSCDDRVYDILWSETIDGQYEDLVTDIQPDPPLNQYFIQMNGNSGFFKVIVRVDE